MDSRLQTLRRHAARRHCAIPGLQVSICSFLLAALFTCAWAEAASAANSGVNEVIARAQSKVVKIYGAGGLRGLEPYQTGFFVSSEGHILTVFSHVLDTDYITAALADGRRFEAKLLGADLRLEAAVLKIDAADLPYFDLHGAVGVDAGARVLALSNLFGVATGSEPTSVQHGIVSVRTQLRARRGVFETLYRGPVYVLDAMTNNPGAAGGVLLTRYGELVGMLGKELRNTLNHTWLNYALPVDEVHRFVEAVRAGRVVAPGENEPRPRPHRSLQLDMLGIALVVDVLERTPPYVDRVRAGSPAARFGIRGDDLIVLLGDRLIQSCRALREELAYADFEDPIKLTVLRGQELLEVTLQYSADAEERRSP